MPTLTFKVTAEEAQRIRTLARRQNVSVSEYLRRRAQLRPEGIRRIRRVRCRQTGALIFAPVAGLPPLTSDSVRGLLTEFP